MRLKPFAVLIGVICLSSTAQSRSNSGRTTEGSASASGAPVYCTAGHTVGKLSLSLTNDGTLGARYNGYIDCFTGLSLLSCDYPRESGISYLYGGAIWIGGVLSGDTLVTTAFAASESYRELVPSDNPNTAMVYRSVLDRSRPAYEGARSEQDFVAVFSDSSIWAGTGNPPDTAFKPLRIEVTQTSSAWSHPLAEDFVLIEYVVKNVGPDPIENLYFGEYVDADVGHPDNNPYMDDLAGFKRTLVSPLLPAACTYGDTLNVAYMHDNDGDWSQQASGYATPHVTGMRFLATPPGADTTSFNWWGPYGTELYDYGPQRRQSYRDLRTGGDGDPVGDANKYHYLSNGEIDFDQMYTSSIKPDDSIWMSPSGYPVDDISDGLDSRYLLSAGPVSSLEPGQTATFVMAYIGGENLQLSPVNYDLNLRLNYRPEEYGRGLRFEDLARNAIVAGWVYDNPGVDTDGDGYSGEFIICQGDTAWVHGDGIPDFRIGSAPASPQTVLSDSGLHVVVRWNGRAAELSRDILTHTQDFEGYHVYLAHGEQPTDFAQVASYDIENFYRFVWDGTRANWVLSSAPMSLRLTRCLYAPNGCEDLGWHPEDFTSTRPFLIPETDSIVYFAKVGANSANFGIETPITKRFPSAPRPRDNWTADSVASDSISLYLTDDGRFRFYEYEYQFDDLLPDEPYWIAVTAFDHGSLLSDGFGEESEIASSAHSVNAPTACCVGTTGNVDCDPSDIMDITDLVVLIDRLFVSFEPLCCPEEANLSGDPEGVVDVHDILWAIDYLFIIFSETPPCQ